LNILKQFDYYMMIVTNPSMQEKMIRLHSSKGTKDEKQRNRCRNLACAHSILFGFLSLVLTLAKPSEVAATATATVTKSMKENEEECNPRWLEQQNKGIVSKVANELSHQDIGEDVTSFRFVDNTMAINSSLSFSPNIRRRNLQGDSQCEQKNRMISSCSSWSDFVTRTYGGTANVFAARVVIPCGVCVTLNHNANVVQTLTFNDGLDVQGRFIIDCTLTPVTNPKLIHLQATMLLVQGYMKLGATCQLPIETSPLIQISMISKPGQSPSSYIPVDPKVASTCMNGVCNVGEKSITIAGFGQIDWNGLPSADTPSWVKLYNVTSAVNPTGIIVSRSVQNKWTIGSTIIITSFTTEWNGFQQVRTITNIQSYASNPMYVELSLNQSIVRPITQVDVSKTPNNPIDDSVEVILLSKNIVLTTPQVITDTQKKTIVGGHLWFYRSYRPQIMNGIDVHSFGQQGILGKYPIHFHFGLTNVNGSIISKNTIRHSSQRCIVIHGTDNITISENVAYDTAGHCFVLEDGIETKNRFIRNIGVMTKKPTFLIPSDPTLKNGIETDDKPSTFWITNPSNDFVENVAAGSVESGYWFEPMKRGPMAELFGHLDPRTDSIGVFANNVAHSNSVVSDMNLKLSVYAIGYMLLTYTTSGSFIASSLSPWFLALIHIERHSYVSKWLLPY
jgi:parallel beta-helix repeat protein